MTYKFRDVGKTCHRTGEKLEPGSRCFSALIYQDGDLVRQDYSAAAWQGPPAGAVAHWQTLVPESREIRQNLDPDALLAWLEQLHEEDVPATEQTRYVIALSLLQQKRAELEGVRQDGEIRYLKLVGSRSEGPWEIREFQLDEQQLADIRGQLRAG